MRMFFLLIAVAVVIAVSAAATVKRSAVDATATTHPVAISIEEIHQQIDVKALPALEIENPF